MSNIFGFSSCLLRLFFLTRAGQQLENEVADAVETYKEIEASQKFDNEKLNEILEMLKKQVPLQPRKCFDLSNSSLSSGFIMALTFAIILLQFKISE